MPNPFGWIENLPKNVGNWSDETLRRLQEDMPNNEDVANAAKSPTQDQIAAALAASSATPQEEMAPPMGSAESLPARSGVDFSAQPPSTTPAAMAAMPTPAAPSAPSKPLQLDTDSVAKALASAQLHGSNIQDIANFGQVGETLAAALSRGAYKPDNSFYEGIRKNADEGERNILTIQDAKRKQIEAKKIIMELEDENKRRDANSDLSKSTRALLNSKNFNIPENMPYTQMKEMIPFLDTVVKSDASAAVADKKLAASQDVALDRIEKEWRTAKNAPGLRGNAAEADWLKTKNAAAHIQGLLADKDLNAAPKLTIEEASRLFDSLLSGGRTTASTYVKMIPSNIGMNKAKFIGWFTNGMPGADQRAFLQQVLKQSQRQGALAEEKIKDYYTRISAPVYGRLKDRPTFTNELKAAGVYDDVVKRAGGGETTSSQQAANAAPAGMAKVSNGKETLIIPIDDLKHAQADGYKEVK